MAKNTFKKTTTTPNFFLKLIPHFLQEKKIRVILGITLIGVSVFIFFALISHLFVGKYDQSTIEYIFNVGLKNNNEPIKNKLGVVGALCSYYLVFKWFGVAAFFIPFISYLFGHRLVFNRSPLNIYKASSISIFCILWINTFICYLQSIINTDKLDFIAGGIGIKLSILIQKYFGAGIIILLSFSILIFIVSLFYNHFFLILNKIKKVFNFKKIKINVLKELPSKEQLIESEAQEYNQFSEDNNNEQCIIFDNKSEVNNNRFQNKNNDEDLILTVDRPLDKKNEESLENYKKIPSTLNEDYDPTLDLSLYKFPETDILLDHDFGSPKVTKEELEQNKDKIVGTLTNFKIGISNIKATVGPTVTLYEIIPDPGVKISKIKNLEDDIALNLAALGIRIIAPIPGKGTIGIEVPNKHREVVPFKSIIHSDKFINNKMNLPIIIGKTISNEIYIADLTQMPHLLIAGATGQGKSVGLNVVLASLLYKKHPSQLKFVLVDPKKVELSLFSKLEKHFLAKLPSNEEAIITVTKEVVHTLNSLCIEMDTRYELLKEAGARNIKEYNTKFIKRKLNPNQGHRFLPYIVLVIDEFADMMMTAGKEVETPVARLAQLARAIGIHLVLATQRPSVNVITGVIKANFPVRISYKVSSKIDSRTILDASGADQLVGKGDLLLSLNSNIIRLQCPYIDTQEIDNICEFISQQQGYPSAYSLPIYEGEAENREGSTVDLKERDSMFEEAARLIVSHQQGSTSLIQRRLKLGYNRAGRLIDQLEVAGIVGPFEGSKAREVLIPDEYSLEILLNNLE